MNKTVTVIVDPVRYKGPRDTDASMFRVAADKCRRGNDIGGSNLRESIATLLDRAADALDDLDGLPPAPLPQSWDIGDEDPGERVNTVKTAEITDEDSRSIVFGRTYETDEWKGYVHGGKVYYSWAELVRRYGPIENATRGVDE